MRSRARRPGRRRALNRAAAPPVCHGEVRPRRERISMEVNGLPLHPLIVHAVVIFVPLGALSAIGFALVQRWRWLLRWPTLLFAIAAVVFTRLAVVSGLQLKTSRDLGGDLLSRPPAWGPRLEDAAPPGRPPPRPAPGVGTPPGVRCLGLRRRGDRRLLGAPRDRTAGRRR